MSLESTAFIGWEDNPDHRLPFERILTKHPILRDEIGSLLHAEHDSKPEIWPFIALASVSYAFNIYKSIGKRSTEHLSHFCQRFGGYGIYATRLSIV